MDGFFVTFLGKWSYLGLFLILIAAGLGIPLPEDIPLIASGWLVYKGKADLWLMILTGLVGVMVGDSLLFSMGRRYGDHIVEHRWLRRIAKPWLIEKARRLFVNHGAKVIFAARFMPGIRAVLFLIAGVFRVPYWKFALMDGTAALISVPVWVWVGAKFSKHLEEIFLATRFGTAGVVGLLVLAMVVWGIYEWRHNLSKKGHEAEADLTPEALSGLIHSAPLRPEGPAAGPAPEAAERPKTTHIVS
ncbi:MAG TPA: DedA family protein [Phycisphaerae bacterium]|nr:DedA family protein [Phycisphaerae bacterium]